MLLTTFGGNPHGFTAKITDFGKIWLNDHSLCFPVRNRWQLCAVNL